MVELVRLEDVLFRDLKNDIAFLMGEYSRFVEETRKHKGDKKALEQAVRKCIAEGIELMKEALKLHAQEKTAKEIAEILELPAEQVQLMLS